MKQWWIMKATEGGSQAAGHSKGLEAALLSNPHMTRTSGLSHKLTTSSYKIELYISKVGSESCLYPVPPLDNPEKESKQNFNFLIMRMGKGHLPYVDKFSASWVLLFSSGVI